MFDFAIENKDTELPDNFNSKGDLITTQHIVAAFADDDLLFLFDNLRISILILRNDTRTF